MALSLKGKAYKGCVSFFRINDTDYHDAKNLKACAYDRIGLASSPKIPLKDWELFFDKIWVRTVIGKYKFTSTNCKYAAKLLYNFGKGGKDYLWTLCNKDERPYSRPTLERLKYVGKYRICSDYYPKYCISDNINWGMYINDATK